ncbi:MAG TPA: arsenate reductase (glutaredoxin) [Luteimonas sp.]|nr:arsenate reductase (glutaredoxin) [Luteimonas sp.]
MNAPDVTIYHNPACGNSRGALALIREAGIEPRVVEYLREPPDRATLQSLLTAMDLPARALLREKEPACAELGLDDPSLDEGALLDAMLSHPVLMQRPIVATPLGTRICRPPETVLDLLPSR